MVKNQFEPGNALNEKFPVEETKYALNKALATLSDPILWLTPGALFRPFFAAQKIPSAEKNRGFLDTEGEKKPCIAKKPAEKIHNLTKNID